MFEKYMVGPRADADPRGSARGRGEKKRRLILKKRWKICAEKEDPRADARRFFSHPEKKEDLRGDFFQMLKKRKIYAEIFA